MNIKVKGHTLQSREENRELTCLSESEESEDIIIQKQTVLINRTELFSPGEQSISEQSENRCLVSEKR